METWQRYSPESPGEAEDTRRDLVKFKRKLLHLALCKNDYFYSKDIYSPHFPTCTYFGFSYQSSPSPAALGAENLPSALNVSLPTVRTEREASSMEEEGEGEERRNQET